MRMQLAAKCHICGTLRYRQVSLGSIDRAVARQRRSAPMWLVRNPAFADTDVR